MPAAAVQWRQDAWHLLTSAGVATAGTDWPLATHHTHNLHCRARSQAVQGAWPAGGPVRGLWAGGGVQGHAARAPACVRAGWPPQV